MTNYKRINKCNLCGDCCGAWNIHLVMKNNNFIDNKEYCTFVEKREDGKFHCKMIEIILQEDPNIDLSTEYVTTSEIRQKIKNYLNITDAQINWCTSQLGFPNPDDEGHIPPRFILADQCPNCTYQIVEV